MQSKCRTLVPQRTSAGLVLPFAQDDVGRDGAAAVSREERFCIVVFIVAIRRICAFVYVGGRLKCCGGVFTSDDGRIGLGISVGRRRIQ